MAEKTKQPPAEPVRLSTNCIVDGVFIPAGEPVPYASEEDLPANLKPLVATGEEPVPFSPAERDFYRPELRRQAGRVLGNVQWQNAAEREAEQAQQLPPETQAELEDAHSRRIALLKAQGEYAAGFTDAAYAQAQAEAETKATEYFVRRGGAWGRVENAKLKPGETVFVKRENGQMEAAGTIDSRGQPPPPEIIL
jgi:hypothetical protein